VGCGPSASRAFFDQLADEVFAAVDALQLPGSVGGGLYPVYPHDGDQVPFDLVQHPIRADAQPAVGAADERAWRRRIVS
jgi:hypothetical protein